MSAEPHADAGHRDPPRPADVLACSVAGCPRATALDVVEERESGEVRVLCRTHRKEYLGVSS